MRPRRPPPRPSRSAAWSPGSSPTTSPEHFPSVRNGGKEPTQQGFPQWLLRSTVDAVGGARCGAHFRGVWMLTVWSDADLARPEGRERLYRGGVFVLSPRPSLTALIEHA